MKTTTLYHCDRCEFTSERAADLSAIRLPANMATSGNADRHLCGRCRGELSEWLGDPAPVPSQGIPHYTHESAEPVGYVDDRGTTSIRERLGGKIYVVVDQDWRLYGRFHTFSDADAQREVLTAATARRKAGTDNREYGVFNLTHSQNAKLLARLETEANATA